MTAGSRASTTSNMFAYLINSPACSPSPSSLPPSLTWTASSPLITRGSPPPPQVPCGWPSPHPTQALTPHVSPTRSRGCTPCSAWALTTHASLVPCGSSQPHLCRCLGCPIPPNSSGLPCSGWEAEDQIGLLTLSPIPECFFFSLLLPKKNTVHSFAYTQDLSALEYLPFFPQLMASPSEITSDSYRFKIGPPSFYLSPFSLYLPVSSLVSFLHRVSPRQSILLEQAA